ncbi:MAG: hypothetical protein NWR12_11640 [Haliea sp.]|nr:hypothetical protein [Haliea sp.]MDP4918362.1 hypothetical protein [Haliea sp.]
MRRRDQPGVGCQCAGYILLLTLIFLALVSTVAAATLRGSVLELRMTTNALFREDALQQALGIAAMIASTPEPFVALQRAGLGACEAPDGCSLKALPWIDDITSVTPAAQHGVRVHYRIRRVGSAGNSSPAVRLREAQATGFVAGHYAQYEVRVSVADRVDGTVRAEVAQGVLLRVPVVSRQEG